jgi:hypothetical protein
MNPSIAYLIFSVLVWIPYGLFCWFNPAFLGQPEVAGLVATIPTATTEVRAMYGGLQTALGLIALAGILREDFRDSALVVLGTITLGLFSARIYGLAVDGGLSNYTIGALIFEATSASLGIGLYLRSIRSA